MAKKSFFAGLTGSDVVPKKTTEDKPQAAAPAPELHPPVDDDLSEFSANIALYEGLLKDAEAAGDTIMVEAYRKLIAEEKAKRDAAAAAKAKAEAEAKAKEKAAAEARAKAEAEAKARAEAAAKAKAKAEAEKAAALKEASSLKAMLDANLATPEKAKALVKALMANPNGYAAVLDFFAEA
ncbi:hypothetical protein IJF86_00550 [Candidatus Saccharibacteria bacterium]|nr:hypothetical protein [Candidatus Saccharibacteria bacterium]